jgi:large subunit ribosomal protein L13
MSTYTAKPKDIEHRWYVVDADGMILGRLAAEVVRILRGKHKPMYTPHMDTGDNVIVINAAKVKLTGRKLEQKKYFSHTGYMGHERFTPAAFMLAKHPDRVIEKAVYGMLPKSAPVARRFAEASRTQRQYPHVAQQPAVLKLNARTKRRSNGPVFDDACHRPPQGSGVPCLCEAGLRQVGRQRTHAGRLFSASVACHRDSAAVHGDRHARPL